MLILPCREKGSFNRKKSNPQTLGYHDDGDISTPGLSLQLVNMCCKDAQIPGWTRSWLPAVARQLQNTPMCYNVTWIKITLKRQSTSVSTDDKHYVFSDLKVNTKNETLKEFYVG